ncbi:MAG: methyltransferase [Spirochaetes bacterium GWD1_61_31]|nr:MAG: methyltransferase [Spirochaetes bacterium GWB1_60_80]OHD41636.1 MAG: methyltransferase [Spirochaetes bacterium GWD1_61_31]OHD41673.1 MAG: methyltransferase [Spirochaetes bacterium GWE1_60_18]OHD60285.1 MAG: methyltransferase [Spirochaetes bacterium GWF1_60_12]
MSAPERIDGACYHAAYGFLHHLQAELPSAYRVDGELLTVMGPARRAFWTRNTWLEPFTFEFDSISQAAKRLKELQRNWAAYPFRLARRCAHIQSSLPHVPIKPRAFPFARPSAPMGAFALLDEHTMLASAVCSSPWPNGQIDFVEDKEGPPSRAYRKLWEALVMAGVWPKPGDRCIDAGATPGGWTWVLAGLGASVTAIDRAPLDPAVAAMPGVTYLKHNAFTLKPEDLGPVDWLCSDVICYPEALYEWVRLWLDASLAKNFICTIKMQGKDWDKATTEAFAAIPGSQVLHLWHNKHELTWICCQPEARNNSSRSE